MTEIEKSFIRGYVACVVFIGMDAFNPELARTCMEISGISKHDCVNAGVDGFDLRVINKLLFNKKKQERKENA